MEESEVSKCNEVLSSQLSQPDVQMYMVSIIEGELKDIEDMLTFQLLVLAPPVTSYVCRHDHSFSKT